MRLNVYNLVHITVNNAPKHIDTFLKNEYSLLIDKDNNTATDILVEFTPDITAHKNFITISPPVGYDREGVFWFDMKGKVCRIELDDFEHKATKVFCNNEFNLHFIAIIIEYLIGFKLLKKDVALCHASAFEWGDKVFMLPAWRHVGKTSILLSFLRDGAKYISDDWVLFYKDGSIASLPKRLNLLYHNLTTFKFLYNHIPDPIKAYTEFIRYANEGHIDLDDGMLSFLQEQIRIRLDVEPIFGHSGDIKKNKCHSVIYLSREIHRIKNDIPLSFTPMNLDVMTTRVVQAVTFEQSHFHTLYIAHKAMTGRTEPFLENRHKKLTEIYRSGLNACQNKYLASFYNSLDHVELKQEILKTFPITKL